MEEDIQREMAAQFDKKTLASTIICILGDDATRLPGYLESSGMVKIPLKKGEKVGWINVRPSTDGESIDVNYIPVGKDEELLNPPHGGMRKEEYELKKRRYESALEKKKKAIVAVTMENFEKARKFGSNREIECLESEWRSSPIVSAFENSLYEINQEFHSKIKDLYKKGIFLNERDSKELADWKKSLVVPKIGEYTECKKEDELDEYDIKDVASWLDE